MLPDFPTQFFGLQNAIVIDKINIYKGLPKAGPMDKPVATSLMGTPVFCDLTIEGGTYTDEAGNSYTFGSIYFDTVIMIIDQQKNIVKTNVQGNDGTVKEYISLGDYNVSINAVFNFDNGTYNRDLISELKGMLIAPVSLKCVSWYLQLWDIDEIVIEAYNIPQQPGIYSQQPVSISAVSNKPVELVLT